LTTGQVRLSDGKMIGGRSEYLVQSRFAETRFAETLTLTLTPKPNFGESGRHRIFWPVFECRQNAIVWRRRGLYACRLWERQRERIICQVNQWKHQTLTT